MPFPHAKSVEFNLGDEIVRGNPRQLPLDGIRELTNASSLGVAREAAVESSLIVPVNKHVATRSQTAARTLSKTKSQEQSSSLGCFLFLVLCKGSYRERVLNYIGIRLHTDESYVAMIAGLQLWPCRFVDDTVEAKFVTCLKLTNAQRIKMAASATILIYAVLVLATVNMKLSNTLTMPTNLAEIALLVGEMVAFIPLGFLLLAAFIKRWDNYLELILYICFSLVIVSITGAFFFVALAFSQCQSQLQCLTIANACNSMLIFHAAVAMISTTLVVQSRIRLAINFVLFIAVCFIFTTIFQAAKIGQIGPRGCPDRSMVDIRNFSIYMIINTMVTIGGQCYIVISCVFWRWISELRSRVDFYRTYLAEKKVQDIRQRQKSHKTKNGSSAVEDIIAYIEEVYASLNAALSYSASPAIATAKHILLDSLNSLSRADKIFNVSKKNPHLRHSAGSIQATAAGALNHNEELLTLLPTLSEVEESSDDPEDAAVEAQFYAMFGGHERSESQIINSEYNNLDSKSKEFTSRPALVDEPGLTYRVTHNWDKSLLQQLHRRIGWDWSLDLLNLSILFPKARMMIYGGFLMLREVFPFFDTDSKLYSLINLATLVDQAYMPNPYHNALHGIVVAHGTLTVARLLRLLDGCSASAGINGRIDLTHFILLWSGMVHDIGHHGRTNAFLCATYDPLAIIYNDNAPLEQYHAALGFRILRHSDGNLFEELRLEEVKFLREKCVELILATDMADHFSIVNSVKVRRRSPEFNYNEDKDDFWLVAKLCIKAADLGHSCVDWPSHLRWSLMVAEEFYQQGEIESAMMLPKSALCNREDHENLAKSQIGFIDYVVQPLLSELEAVDMAGKLSHILTRALLYNRMKWDDLRDSNETVEIPDDIKERRIRDAVWPCETILQWLLEDGTEEPGLPFAKKHSPQAITITTRGKAPSQPTLYEEEISCEGDQTVSTTGHRSNEENNTTNNSSSETPSLESVTVPPLAPPPLAKPCPNCKASKDGLPLKLFETKLRSFED